MNVKAASDGIILAVYGNEGEKVNADQLLVRMSDLTSYKINGAVDENNADIVKTGGTVYAIIGEEKLAGTDWHSQTTDRKQYQYALMFFLNKVIIQS